MNSGEFGPHLVQPLRARMDCDSRDPGRHGEANQGFEDKAHVPCLGRIEVSWSSLARIGLDGLVPQPRSDKKPMSNPDGEIHRHSGWVVQGVLLLALVVLCRAFLLY